jgi:CO dehydrogenase nickel-insertion accessory protein CooC1
MDINYHIITGSKGGVGKSLFSLMQLVHKLEKKELEYLVVILDLNNMNTDIRRSLSYLILEGKDNQPIAFHSVMKNWV